MGFHKSFLRLFKFKSIRARFLMIGFGLFVFVFFVVGFMAVRMESRNIQKNSNADTKAFAELATKPIVEAYDLYFNSGYYKFSEVINDTLGLNKNISAVQIISVNGEVVFDSRFLSPDGYHGGEILFHDNAITQAEPTYRYTGSANPELIEIIYPYFTDWQSHPYSVRYLMDYTKSKAEILNLIYQSVAVLLCLILVSVALLSFATNRSLINPLKLVIETAKSISRGQYGKRVSSESVDEIGDLATSVNQMAKKLEQNIVDLKELDKLKDEFIDVVASNLKIPLNHLKFDVEYLLESLDGKIDSKLIKLIKDVQVNSNKMQLLSDDLINVTRLRKGNFQKNVFMPVNLTTILNEVVLQLKGSLEIKNITVKTNLPEKATILGDYSKLKQLFLNILDNAIQFTTKKESVIEIKMTETESSYVVSVKDNGVGMEPNEVKKLFIKFYRAPSSAIYNKQGVGLGLYLAKLIADVHHGSIWAESKAEEGSTFFVSFLKEGMFKT